MAIIIDGTSYAVTLASLKRNVEFLDKFAERTEDGTLNRELIGVYTNYILVFNQVTDAAVYTALFSKLTEAVEFHTVTVPSDGADFTFTAYFSGISDELFITIDGSNYFKGLTVKFTAQSPRYVPA